MKIVAEQQHTPRPADSGLATGARLQRRCACGGTVGPAGECAACREKRLTLQRMATSVSEHRTPVPEGVHDVLRSPGQPLDLTTRSFMEPRFGHDFSHVRIHTDARAAASARAVNALAYTVGNHVAFDSGQYRPGQNAGMRLLAHELAHVVQQHPGPQQLSTSLEIGTADSPLEADAETTAGRALRGDAPAPSSASHQRVALRRFEKKEQGAIATLADVLNTAKTIAEQSGDDDGIDAAALVQKSGGSSVTGKVGKIVSMESKSAQLPHRYLLTCRCGLLDMRHFYQLMYVSRFYQLMAVSQGASDPTVIQDLANREATQKGREHELEAERTSRFAPEDTASNALGALFGTDIRIWSSPKAYVDKLKEFLSRCTPIDFASLPATEKSTVVDYYGNRDASGAPANPNETATPAVLSLSACGPDRSMPFALDPSDPDKKTLSKAPFNLTGGMEIRQWVARNGEATIRNLPTEEKIRLIHSLLDGWVVSDDDMTAVEKICGSVTSASEMKAINRAVHRREGDLNSDEDKKRLHNAVQRLL